MIGLFLAAMARTAHRASAVPPTFRILGVGQSNIANHFSAESGAGRTALIAAVEAAFPDSDVDYINGAVGSSELLLSTYTANSGSDNDYWVDDTDPLNLAPGPLLLALAGKITGAGYTAGQITHVVYGHLESEATQVAAGVTTRAEVKAGVTFLFNYIKSLCSGVQGIVIQILGTTSADRLGSYQTLREVQRELITERADVHFGAEVYDLARSDTLHYVGNYTTIGNRNGRSIAKLAGASVPSEGPRAVSGTINAGAGTVDLTVQHDGGTTLNGWTSGSVNITPGGGEESFFRVTDPQSRVIPLTAAAVVGTNTVRLTLAQPITSNLLITGGYDSMYLLDYDGVVKDNTAATLPLQTFSGLTVTNPAITSDHLVQEVVNTFAQAETTDAQTITATTVARSSIFARGARIAANVSDATARDFNALASLASSTSLSRTRLNTGGSASDILFGVSVVQWPSSMVESIQTRTVSLTGTTASGTATIDAVDTARSVVRLVGQNSASANLQNINHTVELTNATTVTVTASAGLTSATRNVGVEVITFKPGVVSAIRPVTATLAAGAAQTDVGITAVAPARSMTVWQGFRKTAGTTNETDQNWPTLYLLDEDTVRAERGSTTGTQALEVRGSIVEFAAGYIAAQRGLITIASSSTSQASDIVQVEPANSFVHRTGFRSTSTSTAAENDFFGTVRLSDNNTVLAERPGTGAALTQAFEVITFVGNSPGA